MKYRHWLFLAAVASALFACQKQVENPPRVRQAVLGGAAGALVLAAVAAALVIVRRRRRRQAKG